MESNMVNKFIDENLHIQWGVLHRQLLSNGVSYDEIERAFVRWFNSTSYRPKNRCISQYFHLRHSCLISLLNIKNR